MSEAIKTIEKHKLKAIEAIENSQSFALVSISKDFRKFANSSPSNYREKVVYVEADLTLAASLLEGIIENSRDVHEKIEQSLEEGDDD